MGVACNLNYPKLFFLFPKHFGSAVKNAVAVRNRKPIVGNGHAFFFQHFQAAQNLRARYHAPAALNRQFICFHVGRERVQTGNYAKLQFFTRKFLKPIRQFRAADVVAFIDAVRAGFHHENFIAVLQTADRARAF